MGQRLPAWIGTQASSLYWRTGIRRSRSLPIAAALHTRMVEAARTTLPKQALGEALTYALGQWDKITSILCSGDLPIDNNAVENIVRPIKLGQQLVVLRQLRGREE